MHPPTSPSTQSQTDLQAVPLSTPAPAAPSALAYLPTPSSPIRPCTAAPLLKPTSAPTVASTDTAAGLVPPTLAVEPLQATSSDPSRDEVDDDDVELPPLSNKALFLPLSGPRSHRRRGNKTSERVTKRPRFSESGARCALRQGDPENRVDCCHRELAEDENVDTTGSLPQSLVSQSTAISRQPSLETATERSRIELIFEGLTNQVSLSGRMHGSIERLGDKMESQQTSVDTLNRETAVLAAGLKDLGESVAGRLDDFEDSMKEEVSSLQSSIDEVKRVQQELRDGQQKLADGQHWLAKTQDAILEATKQGFKEVALEMTKSQERMAKNLEDAVLEMKLAQAGGQGMARYTADLLKQAVGRHLGDNSLEGGVSALEEYRYTFVPAAKDKHLFPDDRLGITVQLVSKSKTDQLVRYESGEGSHVATGYKFDIPSEDAQKYYGPLAERLAEGDGAGRVESRVADLEVSMCTLESGLKRSL